MNLSSLKLAAAAKVGRPLLHVQKHSPSIMYGVGVVGVIGTAVLASRATLRSELILQQHIKNLDRTESLLAQERPDYTEENYVQDRRYIYRQTIVGVSKAFLPPVAAATITIGAITGSHVVLSRRNAGLAAAYATIERSFNQYRERVIEDIGEEKELEYLHGTETVTVEEKTEKGTRKKKVKVPAGASTYGRLFDETNKNWSKDWGYNQTFLQAQQNYANDLLRARGHVFLNDVYDMLGYDRTPEGAVVGWISESEGSEGDGFIDFGIFGDMQSGIRFVNHDDRSVILDFNVDGTMYDKI